MLNIDNINKLIEKLKTTKRCELDDDYNIRENGFSMDSYCDDCNSPCCIAGHAIAMDNSDGKVVVPKNKSPNDFAAEKLGLDPEWAEENLFDLRHDEYYNIDISKITPKQAIKALKRIIDAGEGYDSLDYRDLWKGAF